MAALSDIRAQPDWRGRGIGSRLFKKAVTYARSFGCQQLKIEAQNINVRACRFYAS